jgi:Protein of unknown function (DUF2752)
VVDPNEPGHYPPCPFLSLTGWYCPLCGGLRAGHALLHGQIATAASSDLLVVLAPVLLAGLLVDRARRRGRPLPGRVRLALGWAGAAVVVAFWAWRNRPGSPWSAP